MRRNLRLFRYKRIDLFFCFTFFIAFSCLWFIFYCSGREKQYAIDAERCSFRSNALIDIQNFDGILDIDCLLDYQNAVIYIKEFTGYFGAIDSEAIMNVVLSSAQPEKYLGDYNEKSNMGKGISIGYNLEDLIPTSANTVKVDGVEIPYAGRMGCRYSGYGENFLFLPYTMLGETTKSRISHQSSLKIMICSDEEDAVVISNNLIMRLEENSAECEFMVTPYSEPIVNTDMHDEKTLLMFLFAFTVFSCFIATELWVWSRRNELSIHMIYGYSWRKLYFHCCLDGLKLGGIAWLLGFSFFAFIRFIKGDVQIVYFLANTKWILFLLYSIMCVCICILGQFIRMIRNPSISQVIKAEGE